MSSPEDRFAELFEQTHRPLLAYAVRRVTDPADAADVVAETFLIAWRRLQDVPPGDQARLWLFGTARRVLANHYRGERRRHALAHELSLALREVTHPPPQVDTSLAQAMTRLSEDDREILRLAAWEELARDQIAVAMGVSTAAVRVRLHRARRRLLSHLHALDRDLPVPGGGTPAATRTAPHAPTPDTPPQSPPTGHSSNSAVARPIQET